MQPAGWRAPVGYSNGMLAPAGGRLLFVAGQVGWDENQRLVEGGFTAQFARALANVVEVVRAAGGGPEYLTRLTLFVVDKDEYAASRKSVGESYRVIMGAHYPAMSLLEVKGLLEPGARVEIEGTAVIP